MSGQHLISDAAAKLLGLRRLPASLDVPQTAAILGFEEAHIPILVKAGLLSPLGDPAKYGIKKFATFDILAEADDPKWLDKAHRVLNWHWKDKNAKAK